MALVLADRVRETTTVTGTGTATLLGAAPGYQSFSAVGNANTTYYVIANQSATEWEVGIGTYTASGTLLSRDTVLSSSNSGSLVNFSAGTKDVFVDYPAGRAVYEDAAGNVDGYPITGGTINNTTIGATTPSTGVFTTLTATGNTTLGSGSVNWVQIVGSGSGGSPYLYATGGSSAGLDFYTNSSLGFKFRTNNGTNEQARVSHTASAVNYHQLTGSATGSGPIHSVAGSDTNIDYNLTTKGTGGARFNVGNGVKYTYLSSDAANNFQLIGGVGATNLGIYATGGGSIRFYTASGLLEEQLRIPQTASAVNYIQIAGATTGNGPTISAQGSDATAQLNLTGKGGAGVVIFNNGTATPITFSTTPTASSVNYLNVTSSVTGFGPKLSAQGSDTNIPLVLQPKGTGALQAQQTDSTATGGNARGANAVDWQTSRSAANQVASGQVSFVGGGFGNKATGYASVVTGGYGNTESNQGFVGGGSSNTQGGIYGAIVGGSQNTLGSNAYSSIIGAGYQNNAQGYFSSVLGGTLNSTTSGSAVTTQSSTMNGTTAVTLSGSNASIKVGQLVTGTYIPFPNCYVAAISGTSLTLSQAASGSGTSTLSFYTPHGVVVGGGNNQATGSYSFIGGGGDAGTAANRNVASGAWSVVVGGWNNTASGEASFIGGGGSYGGGPGGSVASALGSSVLGGYGNFASGAHASVLAGGNNTASGIYSAAIGGYYQTTRGITGITVFGSRSSFGSTNGQAQNAIFTFSRQTTDATASVLTCDSSTTPSGINQVIMPNNSAYTFRGEVVSGVTGGGNSKSWTIEGLIKRGANAASTTLVGSTVTSMFADVGAATWTIALSADTTNGGLAVTFTGQASTTIRTVCQIRTTEMTY